MKRKKKRSEMSEAQRYLSQIKRYNTMIDSMGEEVVRLRAMVTRITPILKRDVVSGGSRQDKMESALVKLVDLEAEINKKIDAFVDLKREAFALLEKVDDEKQYDVLRKRYILYETFEQIALDMGYSYYGLCKLHGRALREFEKFLLSNNQKKMKS